MDKGEKNEWMQTGATVAGIFALIFAFILVHYGYVDLTHREKTGLTLITRGSIAEKYGAEFGITNGQVSQVSSLPDAPRIEEKTDNRGRGFLGYPSCHSFWAVSKTGSRKHLFSASEADRGSGGSIGYFWSRDGKAVQFLGQHSGIDCPISAMHGELNVIYTISDGVAWSYK